MKDLFKYEKEIINTEDIPDNSKVYSILKQLENLEKIVDLSEIEDCKIRFQDYIDFTKSFQENYEYFIKFYSTDNEILNFNIYYLKKDLSDILEMIITGELTVDDVETLYSDNSYNDINIVFNNIRQGFAKEVNNQPMEEINKIMVKNIIILPNNLNEVKDLSLNAKSGSSISSIKKSLVALEKLICTSYSDKEFSRYIHKIKNGRGNDLRLTEDKILGERYSTGRQTKVGFCKLPVNADNLQKIGDKFKYPNLESIYFVIGFGNFKDIGLKEEDLYSHFITFAFKNEKYLAEIINMVSEPFTKESFEKFSRIIKNSRKDYYDIYRSIPITKQDEDNDDYNRQP